MTQDGVKGQKIDFLFVGLAFLDSRTQKSRNRYVDEVQDNLLIDAKGGHISTSIQIESSHFCSVLRAICRNPDGQFWAGDTAQTISVGSSFRFDDLKAFLHRSEASDL